MPAWTRVRAHAGLWGLVGLLALGLVGCAAAAGPTVARLEDEALRDLVGAAPTASRDITITWRPPGTVASTGRSSLDVSSAGSALDTARGYLPSPLPEATGQEWGSQATGSRRGSLAGDGVTVTNGFLPAVQLVHHTDLLPELTLTTGAAPATDPATGVVEVMTSAAIAEQLGLRVGQEYEVVAGDVRTGLTPHRAQAIPDRLTVRFAGAFTPNRPDAAVWEPWPRLLTPGRAVVEGQPPVPTASAALVTDQAGIDSLVAAGLATPLRLQATARFRLDAGHIDAAWAQPAAEAVALLHRTPAMSQLSLLTGLDDLLGEFRRRAAAYRAVAAVAAAGIISTGTGLLLLAAVLAVERRRTELALLRARGCSVVGLAGRLAAEAALGVAPAALAGWLLHAYLTGGWRPGWLPVLATVAAVLAVPAAAIAAPATGLRSGRAGQGTRTDLIRRRPAPWRLTAELAVLLLAGAGVLLLHRRGLLIAGPDPYLSAVPALVAVAAGLVALRLYPLPLRALLPLAGRRRGVIGFLGLAGAGRANPVTALPLLVLVLAVAVGGFAAGMYRPVRAAGNGLLNLVYLAGFGAAVVSAVLAVALALVSQAPARQRTRWWLHTMGLSGRQARRLLLVELLPPAAAAAVVGALTGAVLPALIGPALGLADLSGGS